MYNLLCNTYILLCISNTVQETPVAHLTQGSTNTSIRVEHADDNTEMELTLHSDVYVWIAE